MICDVLEGLRELPGAAAPPAHPYSLHLWLGAARSVVFYIVPVFKNILPSRLYSPLPTPQAWGSNSMTLRILDSRTTQGTGLQDLLGPPVKIRPPILCGDRVAAIP